MLQSDPSPAELAEKTIDYAEAKAACFNALRAELLRKKRMRFRFRNRSDLLN